MEGETIGEKNGITAGNRVVRVQQGKAKESKMPIYEKLDFIGFVSRRTAPFSFTIESI